MAPLEAALLGELAARFQGDAAHDMAHLRRVLALARRIAAAEGPHDAEVLTAAALLHDLVALPKNHPDRARASTLAAEAACALLAGLGFPPARLPAVAHAIAAHSFAANIAPATPEARALQDADRLDALGAIGIARTFMVGGALGRALADAADPLAEHRAPDDTRFTLDHFPAKLLRLPGLMTTASGRALATARVRFMRRFLRRITQELRG